MKNDASKSNLALVVTIQQINIQNMSKFKDNHMAHFGLIEDIHNLIRRSH